MVFPRPAREDFIVANRNLAIRRWHKRLNIDIKQARNQRGADEPGLWSIDQPQWIEDLDLSFEIGNTPWIFKCWLTSSCGVPQMCP